MSDVKQQGSTPQLVNWLDLSPYGAALAALRFPDGKLRIVISGFKDGGGDWNWLCDTLGFRPTVSRSMLFRDGAKIELSRLVEKFPKAVRVKLPPNKIIRVASVVPAPTRDSKTADHPDVEVRSAMPLGINHLGQQVFEGATGRFVRQQEKGVTLGEGEVNSPAVFLRAATSEDLALCAEGLVEEMLRGAVMKADDLRRFAHTIYEKGAGRVESSDARLREVQEALESAMQRRLQRDITAPNTEAFDLAVRLVERQPAFVYRTTTSMELQQYSTPLPLAIAAQRLLGNTAGKRILEPTIGNASMVTAVSADATVVGVELDTNRVRQAAGMRSNISVTHGDFTKLASTLGEFDLVISNPPFGGLRPEQNIEGLRVTRLDHLILMQSLALRKPEGRSVFVINTDRNNLFDKNLGVLSGGSKNLFNWLADHYEIVAAADVDGRLYEKQGAGVPVRLVVVGNRRLPEEILEARSTEKYRIKQLPVLRSWDQVWSFTEKHAPDITDEPAEVFANEESVPRLENDFQAPYHPASKAREPDSMIPRNLLAATSAALDSLEVVHGTVDEFVADRLQIPESKLGRFFSAEQVDAIALSISRAESGRGFILADQTGLGKGRVLAGLARYAALNKRPVLFLTEKPNLFSDFYRDIADIGSADLFVPLMVNDGIEIRGQNNERIFPPTTKGVLQRMISGGESPLDHGYNLTLATYSQFNRSSTSGGKSHWLPIAAEGALMILDESHNAAGESNTATNVAAAVDRCWASGYSSATYAKGAKNMAAYVKAFPVGMCAGDIAETLEVGGEPLQEILSAMLAEDGALIRREHDLSHVQFETLVDEEFRERNEEMADALAEILQQLSAMSGDVSLHAVKLEKEIKKNLEKLSEEQRQGSRMGVSYTNFGSRLYNLLRQFQLAIKVDAAIADSLQSLAEGRKPVYVLEQTFEAVLVDALAGEDGEEAVLADGVTIEPLTFRDVLFRVLDRIDKISVRNGYGEVTVEDPISLAETPEEAGAWLDLKDRLREKIAAFPDLPILAIDQIREGLHAAGYSVGEISGRQYQLSTRDDGKLSVLPRSNDRLKVIHQFNNGGLDAVILTRAGSTGLSLHASEKFADQRQRELYELQIANNVAERMQFFGRVNRKGQVCAPRITTIASGLPGEMRLLAMQNSKMRKLSANTQSNRSSLAEMKDVPDVLNRLGSEICLRYLENNPGIALRLGIDLDGADERLVADEAWFANKVTGYVSLLSIAEQKMILAQLFEEYETTLKELDAMGENPFKASEFDWRARVVRREVLDGAEVDGTVEMSPFARPVYLTQVEFERDIQSLRWAEVQELLQAGEEYILKDRRVTRLGSVFDVSSLVEAVRKRFECVMRDSACVAKFDSVDEALGAEGPNPVKNAKARSDALVAMLPLVMPGRRIRFKGSMGEEVTGLVTSIRLPEMGKESHAGKYDLKIAVPGEGRLVDITLNGLLGTEGFGPAYSWPRGRSDQDAFDSAPSGKQVFRRTLLDGNLFRAAQIAVERGLGRTMIYTDEEGVRHRAVLVKSEFTPEQICEMPLRIESAQEAASLLMATPVAGLFESAALEQKKGAVVRILGPDALITVPGKKALCAHLFSNKKLMACVGEFSGTRAAMTARFPVQRLEEALGLMFANLSKPLYVNSKYREQLAEVRRQFANSKSTVCASAGMKL